MTFTSELNQLIRKHTSKARFGDDFIPILDALCIAADKLAVQADGCRCRDETEAESTSGRPLLPP